MHYCVRDLCAGPAAEWGPGAWQHGNAQGVQAIGSGRDAAMRAQLQEAFDPRGMAEGEPQVMQLHC
jgi:hypothetical protein